MSKVDKRRLLKELLNGKIGDVRKKALATLSKRKGITMGEARKYQAKKILNKKRP
jgi:hypothetical protein